VVAEPSMNRFTGRMYLVLLLVSVLCQPTAAGGQAHEDEVNVVEIGGVEAVFVNSSLYSPDAAEEIGEWVDRGAPVVFYGEQPELLLDVYRPRIHVEGSSSGDSRLVVLGIIAAEGNRSNEFVLRVLDRSFTMDALEYAYGWVEDSRGETGWCVCWATTQRHTTGTTPR